MNIKKLNKICCPLYKRNCLMLLALTPFCTTTVNLAAYISNYILLKYFYGGFVCFLLARVYKIHIRKRNFIMHINKFTCRKKCSWFSVLVLIWTCCCLYNALKVSKLCAINNLLYNILYYQVFPSNLDTNWWVNKKILEENWILFTYGKEITE